MNNVLIIEDDKEICVMIKDHLEKYNYQVFFTLTGANAIERIKELSPDLIILDLMLPFISGDELIRNIRKFSDVPVIVVSAKSLTFNKVELLRLGADDYLTKPFDLDELLTLQSGTGITGQRRQRSPQHDREVKLWLYQQGRLRINATATAY